MSFAGRVIIDWWIFATTWEVLAEAVVVLESG